jgi:CBS domain-containing protein
MSREVHSCSPGDSIDRVLAVMNAKRVRRVPIVAEGGELVGIVALADIARWASTNGDRSSTYGALAHTVAMVSTPPQPGQRQAAR